MKKITLSLFAVLIVAGCGAPKSKYILAPISNQKIYTTTAQIGIKKVEVPNYLLSDTIMVKEGLKLTPLNANFADSIDSLLTNKAIKDLKTITGDPNIFLYPWDVKKKKGMIIKIVIDDYLYYDNAVHLKGSYYITTAKGAAVKSKNFNFEIESEKSANDIVRTLGELFDKLIREISQTIPR